MTDNTCDDLNFAGSPNLRKHSSDENTSENKNDQSMIKTSNFYCQKENPPYIVHNSDQLSMSSIDILSSSKQEVKICLETEIESKSISLNSTKTPIAANKPIRNVFDKTLFTGKPSKSCKKVSVGKIWFKTSPKAKDPTARKRCFLDITGDGINQARLCKKVRIDENMNTKDLEDCVIHKERRQDSISDRLPEVHRATGMCMLTAKDEDVVGFVPGVSKISRTLDSGLCHEREPNSEGSKSSLYIKSENVQTVNFKEKDSGFQETFSILEDKQCPSLCSSPDLFTPVSSCGSSGFISSSNSTTCSPHDLQSSITKYFTPVRAGENEMFHSARNNFNLSPSADRTGKRNLKATRKDVSPSSSPVSGKMEQMYLDLGQKDFGHVTCQTCNMVYTRAQPEDEADHLKFHRKFVTGLRFLGWKTERVVDQFDDGRIIVVLPHDHHTHQRKVTNVRTVVDSELGFSSETSLRMQDSQTYMFITKKKVVGCIVAVEIQKAYPMLPSTAEDHCKPSVFQVAWCCSSTPVRAQCGISRVWVLQQYRRKGIATRLLECVRKHFMFGCVIAKESLAFSDPTPLGKRLAESYSGTERFLVFR